MGERSAASASAERLEAAGTGLKQKSHDLSEMRTRVGARIQAALDEIPRYAETVRNATGTLLTGLRGV